MQKTDEPFIYNSWLRSFRNSKKMQDLTNEQYYPAQKERILALLDWARVIVACDLEDEWHVYGYAVARVVNGVCVLDYVYVKKPFRKLGIGKALLFAVARPHEPPTTTTHQTSAALKFLGLKEARDANSAG